MAISKVVVVDGNNLIVRIDRGVAGRGVTDVEPVEIDGSLYLVFTFSDGTTETIGPVGTIQYIGQAPIVVTGSTISLNTVPVAKGGTGQVTANAGFNALAPTQTGNSGKYLKTDGTNSAWDLLDISTADITGVLPLANGGTASTTASGARTNLGLGTIATQDASNVSITGGTITGITDLAVADGGTGSSTAAGAMVNLLPSYTGNANKRLGLDGTATGLEWVTDGGGTVTSVDVSGGTTGLSFSGGPVTTSGTITLSGTLDLDNGGTGATTAAGARTNLNAVDQATTLTAGTGLSGGGDLTTNRSFSITNTGVTAAAYGAASKTLTATVNAQGQLTVLADTPIAIANTQISGLGTMSTQNSNSVAITGGSITGITDLAVADGGTGASDAAGARTNLNAANQATTITAGTGLSGGGDLSANRTIDIANTTVTAGAFGSASNTLTATVNSQGQLTALAATPIAIANTQVSGLGTMSTQNSNAVTITGGSITGITDLAIADGGTGASNAADARSNLGLGSAAVLNAGVALGVATLDAGGTVPLSQIPASIQGGVSYQGAWNASTNTPTLVSSVGSKGYYYVVSVAGNTNLNGVTDWLVGDWAIYNGTAWEKIDNTDQVASVNGYTGVVVLSNTDVGAPPTSLTISAGTGLTGGGSLAANRTLSIANTTVTAAPYGTASAVPTFTVNGQGQLTAASDVTIAIANTQVSGLGTMSTQNANSVAITGGSITGITDLAIADGGTGASTAGGALTNLGAIGTITSTDGSIVVTPSGTTVNLAVSEASPASTLLTQVRNTTGSTLTKGTVVYISGATGQIATVSKAIATGDATSAQTLGMITANLANNTNGYVTVFGLLENMDTSAYTDGAQLYLSGTVAGEVTATKPSAPIHLVYVAVVEYAHPTQGKLLVKVQNGYELDEIHDVSIVTPVTGQTLVYNSATDLWVNNTVSLTAGVNGTLPVANGGTGQTTAATAITALAGTQTSGYYLRSDGTNTALAAIQAADVPTLNQNTTGTAANITATTNTTLTTLSSLSLAGSQVTGNISGNAANVTGTVAIANGGTGQTTANAAFNALAPSQTGNSGKYLTTDGTDTSWASNPLGTVTSVAASVPSFLSIAGSPITTSGTLAISLSGTALPTTSGGTGLTSFTANGIVYASSSSALATGSALQFDGTFLTASRGITVNGSGIATSGFYNGINVSGFDALGWSGSSTLAFGGYRASQWTQLDFYTGGTTRLSLTTSALSTASGIYVGIGTNNVTSPLTVSAIGSAIELKLGTIGSPCYYVMDNTLESGGKRWRFGYTGAASVSTFSLYNQTNDILLWSADSAGNFGIGAPAPSAKLELYSTADANFGEKIYHNSSSLGTNRYPQLEFSQTPTGQSYQNAVILRQQNSSFGNYPSFAIITNAASAGENTRVFLDGFTGNMLVGNTNLNYARLSVFGAISDPSLTVGTTATAVISGGAGQELAITESNTAPYTISLQARNNTSGPSGYSYPIALNPLGGNVGIATSLPTSKLQVGDGSPRETTASFFGTGNSIASSIATVGIYSTDTSGIGVGPSLALGGQTGNAANPYPFGIIQGAKNSATAGDYGGYLQFNTIPANGGSPIPNLTLTTGGGVQAYTTISVGAAGPATSGAGITFPATQSASSNTNTLDDYEEGTWFPNQGSGLTVVGTFESVGYYTKIGNIVTITGYVRGLTNISCSVGGIICTNAPFPGGVGGIFWSGTAMNWNADSSSVCGVQQATTNIYSASVISASDRISFTITYQAG